VENGKSLELVGRRVGVRERRLGDGEFFLISRKGARLGVRGAGGGNTFQFAGMAVMQN